MLSCAEAYAVGWLVLGFAATAWIYFAASSYLKLIKMKRGWRKN